MYTSRVKFRMVCPACHRIEDVSLCVMTKDNYHCYAGVDMRCPICRTPMYQADSLMLDSLVELNRLGIQTAFHCTELHGDGFYETYGDEDDGLGHYPGPHLAVRKLQLRDRRTLYKLWKSGAVSNFQIEIVESRSSKLKAALHIPLGWDDIISIHMYIPDTSFSTRMVAVQSFNKFLMTWAEILEEDMLNGERVLLGSEEFSKTANPSMIRMDRPNANNIRNGVI